MFKPEIRDKTWDNTERCRRADRVIESVCISLAEGVLGIVFGFALSWLIAEVAEWRTIVTSASIAVAFGVSAGVGVVFGI